MDVRRNQAAELIRIMFAPFGMTSFSIVAHYITLNGETRRDAFHVMAPDVQEAGQAVRDLVEGCGHTVTAIFDIPGQHSLEELKAVGKRVPEDSRVLYVSPDLLGSDKD